ncbi:hypothetical protein Goklo_000079, partial [Gossypium klotzschianum]|nr:hypothetical protein [Gossypium klotzschianum]
SKNLQEILEELTVSSSKWTVSKQGIHTCRREYLSPLAKHIGHVIKDYNDTPNKSKELSKDDLPFSLSLKAKAKSNVIEKVSTQLGVTMNKSMPQRYYLGRSDEGIEGNMNSNTFQKRKKTPVKDNLEIREVETKLNSNWLRPNIKEKDIDKVQCEGKEECNEEISLSQSLIRIEWNIMVIQLGPIPL